MSEVQVGAVIGDRCEVLFYGLVAPFYVRGALVGFLIFLGVGVVFHLSCQLHQNIGTLGLGDQAGVSTAALHTLPSSATLDRTAPKMFS